MLPNAIIAGVPRAGTTSLFRWLTDHPDVAGSLEKETYFFVDPGTHAYRPERNFTAHGLRGYEACFPAETSCRVVIESTPQYIYQSLALAELPDLPTRPKFIFSLREPAGQIYSLFQYFRSIQPHIERRTTFAGYLERARTRDAGMSNELLRDALVNGDHQRHLDRWFIRIGQPRIFVCLFEETIKNPAASVKAIANFLGIDPQFYDNYNFTRLNESYEVRSFFIQKLNIWTRDFFPRDPRDPLFRVARSAYRSLNVKRAASVNLSPPDRDALESLSAEFALRYAAVTARYRLAASDVCGSCTPPA